MLGIEPPQHECPICLEKFVLSITLFVHKMHKHLPSETVTACRQDEKISTFLLDLLIEESLYWCDTESEYTFTVVTSVHQMPRQDVKTEIDDKANANDWVYPESDTPNPSDADDDHSNAILAAPTVVYTKYRSPFNRKRRTSSNATWASTARAITTTQLETENGYSECQKCGKSVLTNSLKDHLQNPVQCWAAIVTDAPAPLAHAPPLTDASFACTLCNAKFGKEMGLVVHQISKHRRPENETAVSLIAATESDESCYTCTLCHIEFADRKDIFWHLRREHKRRLKQIDFSADQCYACDACPKTFKPFLRFAAHQRSAHFDLTHLCSICGQAYVNATRLRSHMHVHSGERPYECETCGKRFTEKRTIRDHMRLHTGEKPYVCRVVGCDGRAFAQESGLRQHHLMAHQTTGGRYHCQVCDKRFTLRRFYTDHVRLHTGERPYECEFCGMRFRIDKGLRVHRRIHTGERPFTCDKCNKGFSTRRCLKLHLGTKKSCLPL